MFTYLLTGKTRWRPNSGNLTFRIYFFEIFNREYKAIKTRKVIFMQITQLLGSCNSFMGFWQIGYEVCVTLIVCGCTIPLSSHLVSLSSHRTQLIDMHKGRSRSVDNAGGSWHWSKWQRCWNGAAVAMSKVEHKGQALLWQGCKRRGALGQNNRHLKWQVSVWKRGLKIRLLLSIGPCVCFLFSVQECMNSVVEYTWVTAVY